MRRACFLKFTTAFHIHVFFLLGTNFPKTYRDCATCVFFEIYHTASHSRFFFTRKDTLSTELISNFLGFELKLYELVRPI